MRAKKGESSAERDIESTSKIEENENELKVDCKMSEAYRPNPEPPSLAQGRLS